MKPRRNVELILGPVQGHIIAGGAGFSPLQCGSRKKRRSGLKAALHNHASTFLRLSLGLAQLAAMACLGADVPASATVPPTAQPRPPISTLGTVEEFPPVAARYVRMTILKTTAGKPTLDEVEVFTAEAAPRNVALAAKGGRASGAGPSNFTHEMERINDGR